MHQTNETTVVMFDISLLHLHWQETDHSRMLTLMRVLGLSVQWLCWTTCSCLQPALYEPTASTCLEPWGHEERNWSLGFSKDSSWLPAFSGSSIPVFTFWNDLDRERALRGDISNDCCPFLLLFFILKGAPCELHFNIVSTSVQIPLYLLSSPSTILYRSQLYWHNENRCKMYCN